MTWPDLSTVKFVSNRLATEADIIQGAAVFMLQADDQPIGKPLSIDVPQYAVHTDGQSGEKSNVVIIQAEEANGQQILGALVISSNKLIAGLYEEFILLGNSKPS